MMVLRQALHLTCLLNRQRNRQSRMRRLTKFRLEHTKQFLLFIVLVGFVTGQYYCNAEWETWIKERSSDWWEWIVPQFTSDEWRENFRMSPETFGYICCDLQPYFVEARHSHKKGSKCQENACHYSLASINKCRLWKYCALIWHC